MDLDYSATDLVKLFRNNKASLILGISLLIPFLLIMSAIFQSWQATFSVQAQTGVVEIITNENQPNWALEAISISVDNNEAEVLDGILTISKDTKIRFQALADGSIYAVISPTKMANADSPIIIFDNSLTGSTVIATELFEMHFPLSSLTGQYTFPIQGTLKLGDALHSQISTGNPILMTGSIQVFGDALFGDGRFKALNEELEAGDQISLSNRNDEPVVGFGFIGLNQSHSMQLQYHAESDSVEVSRFGSDGYSVEPTIWDRLSFDPILKIIVDFLTTWIPVVLAFFLISFRLFDARNEIIKEESSSENQN